MTPRRSSFIPILLASVCGCGSGALKVSRPDAADAPPATGLGGVADPGGMVGSAGMPGTGGLSGTGGASTAVGTGGAQGTGGFRGTGGKTGMGGRAGTGGAQGTGGAWGTGGRASTGGIPSTGGIRSSGGTAGRLGGSGGADAGWDVGTACSASITANEANNFTFSSAFTLPPVVVAANTELTFDWSGVTRDFRERALDARQDINTVLVFLWKLSLADLEKKINTDTLLMRDLVTLPLEFTTNGSDLNARLFQFSNTGQPTHEQLLSFLDPDAYPADRYTYSLMVATGSDLGQGTRMIQAFTLSKNTTVSTVYITSDSTKLTWQADIAKAKVTAAPAGNAQLTLEWGLMRTNALGQPFDPPDAITKVLIGHYKESPAELAQKVLDLDSIAIELYQDGAVAGTSASLAWLKTDGGRSFQGIDDKGTWLLALQCGACRNPAPWYLTVLKPCQ